MAETLREESRNALRGNTLVCVALLMGQAMYAIVIVALYSIESMGFEAPIAGSDLQNTLAITGLAVGVIALPTAFVMRKLMWQRGAGGDDAKLRDAFGFGNIAFQVVLEGAGLLNLTLALATGELIPYAPVFAVVFLVGVATVFRTRAPLR